MPMYCYSYWNPNRLGQLCLSRRNIKSQHEICKDCEVAIRKRLADNNFPAVLVRNRAQFVLQRGLAAKAARNARDNVTREIYMANNPGKNRQYLNTRNGKRLGQRNTLHNAHLLDDHDTIMDAADNMANQEKRRLAAIAGIEVDAMDLLAEDITMVAGFASDFVNHPLQNYVTIGSTCAAARSNAHCLQVLHGWRHQYERFVSKQGVNPNAVPKVTSTLIFRSRNFEVKDSRQLFGLTAIDNQAVINRTENCGNQIYRFRKAVQNEYATTLESRKTESVTPLITLARARQLCIPYV